MYQLGFLELTDTAVTDAGLEHLRPLKRPAPLYLDGTGVTDKGMAALAAGAGRLETLSVSRTRITDVGVASLSRLPRLYWLEMVDDPVTDRGLLTLKGCPQLQRLKAHGTQVTPAGMAGLRKALPGLEEAR